LDYSNEFLYTKPLYPSPKTQSLAALGLSALLIIDPIGLSSSAIAQIPPLAMPESSPLPPGVAQRGTLESAPVRLDGKTLFRIASPAVVNRNDPGYLVPVEARASQIQGNLQQLLPNLRTRTTAIPPGSLNVVVRQVNGFPVLFAESPFLPQPRVLLTVTGADAQYYGVSTDELASQWQTVLEQKLRQALAIRQPGALGTQLRLFFKVLAGTLLITLVLGIVWIMLGRRESYLRQQYQNQSSLMQAQQDTVDDPAHVPTTSTPHSANHLLRLQRRRQFVQFLRWLNFWMITFAWAGGTAYALRLFPQTRQLARQVVLAPLFLLVAWFVLGLINRLIDFTTDKVVQQLADSQILTPSDLQRITTITKVVKGVKMVLVYTIGALLVFQWLDLLPGTVLALGTLAALVVSLGAQNLIRDLVNGFMILVEDQYRIGDVVGIGTKGGLVTDFNLRITQLRNPDGHLITVPNSVITEVENLSRDWSRADFRIEVAYDTDVDLALSIVRRTTEKMARDPKWRNQILDTREFFGVDHISHQGMVIRIWIKTLPIKQWDVAMELRRLLKKAFDEHDIRIGIPQQLWIQNESSSGYLEK